MIEQSPVETLREIRANFAALQAERDILSDELNSERECSTALGAYLDQAHKDVEQISDELSAARARIAELERKIREEHYAYTVMAKANDDHMEYIAELEERIDVAEGMSYKRSLRIAELEAAQRWVPVGERLPDRGQTVYGWINPVSYLPGHGKEMTYMPMLNPGYPWRSTWDMATYSALDITHWQPLPAVPEASNAR